MGLENYVGAFFRKVGPDFDGAFVLAFLNDHVMSSSGNYGLAFVSHAVGLALLSATATYVIDVKNREPNVAAFADRYGGDWDAYLAGKKK